MTTSILASFTPNAAETQLLRACLDRPGAWEAFLRLEPDPEAFARRDNRGFKQLLPLLAHTLGDRLATDPFRAPLRLAIMREELRWNTFRSSAQDILGLVTDAGFAPLVTGGTALAETVFSVPILRHCHDLDLLVPSAVLPRVEAVLAASRLGSTERALGGSFFRHTSGLEVRVHATLTAPPHRLRSIDTVVACAVPVDVCGVPVLVPAPADLLIQTLANGRGSRPGRWASDAAMIATQHPELAWDLVLQAVWGSNAAVQFATMVRYLSEALGIPVPVREDLDRQASASGPIAHELAAALLRSSTKDALRTALASTGSLPDRLALAMRTIFPSTGFQRSMNAPVPTPQFHLQRAMRFARSLVAKA